MTTPLQRSVYYRLKNGNLSQNQKKDIYNLIVAYAKKYNLNEGRDYYTIEDGNKCDLTFSVDDIDEENDETLLALQAVLMEKSN